MPINANLNNKGKRLGDETHQGSGNQNQFLTPNLGGPYECLSLGWKQEKHRTDAFNKSLRKFYANKKGFQSKKTLKPLF